MRVCPKCDKDETQTRFYNPKNKKGNVCAPCILKQQKQYRLYKDPMWRDKLLRNWKRAG